MALGVQVAEALGVFILTLELLLEVMVAEKAAIVEALEIVVFACLLHSRCWWWWWLWNRWLKHW